MSKRDEAGFRPARDERDRRRDEMAARYPGPDRAEPDRAVADEEIDRRNRDRAERGHGPG